MNIFDIYFYSCIFPLSRSRTLIHPMIHRRLTELRGLYVVQPHQKKYDILTIGKCIMYRHTRHTDRQVLFKSFDWPAKGLKTLSPQNLW